MFFQFTTSVWALNKGLCVLSDSLCHSAVLWNEPLSHMIYLVYHTLKTVATFVTLYCSQFFL